MTVESEVDREDEHSEYQTNRSGDGKCASFARTGSGVDCRVVNVLERSLIEVTRRVGVGEDEEALGAAFHGRGFYGSSEPDLHGCQSLKGFLRMRPVFLRIEPTFESSFFSAVARVAGFVCKLVDAFVEAFFTGTAAVFAVAGLGSSTAG